MVKIFDRAFYCETIPDNDNTPIIRNIWCGMTLVMTVIEPRPIEYWGRG